ncbi:MAG: hypothetical protein ACYC4L_18455, partial [Chloroflexota bacterium]
GWAGGWGRRPTQPRVATRPSAARGKVDDEHFSVEAWFMDGGVMAAVGGLVLIVVLAVLLSRITGGNRT